jgi:hypothetical protein
MSFLRASSLLAALALALGCEKAPQGGPTDEALRLSDADLQTRWIALHVPRALEAPHVIRGATGFLALAREFLGEGKVVLGINNYLYQSDDGAHWRRLPLGDKPEHLGFRGVGFGAGRYVLAGSGGGMNQIWTSADGLGWSKQSFSFDPSNLSAVSYAGGRFFAHSTFRELLTSADGVEWKLITFQTTVQTSAVAFGNGRFVLVGSGALQLSSDGVGWQARSLDCALPGACITDPSGGVHQGYHPYVVFAGGRFYVDNVSSADGVTWLPHADPIAADYVGGYLFGHTGADPHRLLQAWKPGGPAVVIDLERLTAPPPLSANTAPETIDVVPPGGETCATHRCAIIDGGLYLIR